MVIDVFNPNPLIEWQFNNAKSDQTLIGGVLVSSDVMWLWLFLPGRRRLVNKNILTFLLFHNPEIIETGRFDLIKAFSFQQVW